MRYSPTPPYEIVDTKTLNATEIAELKRMAKVWDLVSNRGYFMRSLALLEGEPPFQWLRELTESVRKRCSRTHSIDLLLLAELLYQYLSEVRLKPPETVARALLEDLKIPSVRPAPAFLKPYLYARAKPALNESPRRSAAPKRQQRFL
jgi:Protein of unknown function (DUF4080)